MKKFLALFLCAVMLFSVCAVAVFADEEPVTDNTVMELDFSKISEIANITAENGAKSSFQIGDTTGWMSSKSEFVQDDGVQVLKYVRDDGLLHGFDLNSLKGITTDPVVYSMTFKVAKMEGFSYFQLGMVTQNASNQSWFYSFRLLADGTMKLDTNGGGVTAAGTDAGTLSFNEYHTLSIVYWRNPTKQAYYLDGELICEAEGYRQGAITSPINDITRFKIETPKADGNVEIYFKNVKVYNSDLPEEVAAALAAREVITLDFSKISTIGDITTDKGAKSSFKIDTGWLSDKCELMQDDGVQVLKYVRDDKLLHGFDVNSLKDLTGDPVVYSMTFKVAKMDEGSWFQVGMVTQNASNQSWFYSYRLLADGTMKLDTNGGGVSATGTDAGKLSFGEYHTLSIVYWRNPAKQAYYLDGVLVQEATGYRQGAITSPIGPVTRFKIETPKADGDVEMYFKNVKVYNAELPDEAAGLSNVKESAVKALKESFNAADYKAETLTQINAIVTEYEGKINAATSSEAVGAALAEGKEKIAAIEPDSDAALLAAAVSGAVEKLENHVVVSNYRPDDQTMLNAIISEYTAKIRAAKDTAEVAALLAEGTGKLDQIEPPSPGEIIPVLDMNFAEIESIGNLTFPNGAKSVFQIGDSTGWLSSKCEFVGEGENRVFHFVRDDKLLHGFDINSLAGLTGDPVVFSMTFSYQTLAGTFYVSAVDQTGSTARWFYSITILEDGRVFLNAKTRSADAEDKVYAGTITPNEYHTISLVYFLSGNKQECYIDGDLAATVEGYGHQTTPPAAITRFKLESLAADGNVDMNFKSISIYNGEMPIEAVSVESTVKAALDSINKYDDDKTYAAEDLTAIRALIAEYKTKLEAAKDSTEVMKLLAEVQAKLNEIPNAEERAALNKLNAAKEAAKSEINGLVNLEDYSAENRTKVEQLIAKALSDIDLQTDEDALARVLKISRNKILEVEKQGEETTGTDNSTTTEAPGTASADESAGTETPSDPSKAGCKSVLSASVMVLFAIALIPAVLRKKKD